MGNQLSFIISSLLARLKKLEVDRTALEWFGSYLSGHQQYIRFSAGASAVGVNSDVVPQDPS